MTQSSGVTSVLRVPNGYRHCFRDGKVVFCEMIPWRNWGKTGEDEEVDEKSTERLDCQRCEDERPVQQLSTRLAVSMYQVGQESNERAAWSTT